MSGDDSLAIIAAARLIPVVVLEHADRAEPLGMALAAGGLRVVEVTFRTDAAEAALRTMAAMTGMCVGAGTVVTPAQVDRAVDAGARFVVSPGLSSGLVRRCRARGVRVFPGVATATEVMAALDLGVDVMKFFPAQSLGGPAMLRALGAPFPAVRFIPTGGITATTMSEYLGLPAVVAVGGSWMVAPSLVAAADWARITALTAAAVAAVRQQAVVA